MSLLQSAVTAAPHRQYWKVISMMNSYYRWLYFSTVRKRKAKNLT